MLKCAARLKRATQMISESLDPTSSTKVAQPIKGRGGISNTQSRYIRVRSELADDGWGCDPRADDRPPQTQLFLDQTKKLITTNKSPDISFRQSINPYKGCEHGCIYCFARPTHAYLDLSAGLDFETKIFRKSNPRACLLGELSRPNYVCEVIAMGTNTDPYQPFERTQKVTREILETLYECKHPVSIVTKSKLILRDLDLLERMAEEGLVNVNVSVTTLSNSLKTKLEPRTASAAARLRAIAELRAHGVPTGALVAPIIPFINDHEIEDVVAAAGQAGAQALNYVLLRLPLEVAPLFTEWLKVHFPDRAKRVLAAVRDTRGGSLYRSLWYQRMQGQGEIAELIRTRFRRALKAHGLNGCALPSVRTDLFEAPAPLAMKTRNECQMELFKA